MLIEVVPYSAQWPAQFAQVASDLSRALAKVRVTAIEHVGSTSVPGLAAKPIIDVDVLVARDQMIAAIAGLEAVGYRHCGDLGVTDREAFYSPDDDPVRHVYVCVDGSLHVRNHLAVRAVLRGNADLRDRYGEVKTELARRDPGIGIEAYTAGKSAVLQEVLELSDLSADERAIIDRLNRGGIAS